jgi:antitoxin VapB
MALNLKNAEVERLAAEVAALARESKTEAIRRALVERKTRLAAVAAPLTRSQRAASILAAFRASLPASTRRKRLTRKQEDEILGFGPDGI